MQKKICLAMCAVIFGAFLVSGQTSDTTITPVSLKIKKAEINTAAATPTTATTRTSFNSQEELKGKLMEIFDSLGTDPETKYDVVVITINHFKQSKRTNIDSTSIKLSNTGISALEVTSGKTVKEVITLRSGKIGGRLVNNMEVGEPRTQEFSSKVQIGTYTAAK